ncbi:MAG TPA: TolC family protein [Bacteroidales bacterium]|nr:TolC family protein [Bacteroidales bacterium]
MKRILLFLILMIGAVSFLSAQLTIDALQESARQNYPQIKQFDLISKSADFNLSNVTKAYLPQVNLSGRATYQSDAINFTKGAFSIKQDKDQYQAVAEVNQVLWDGGVLKARKQTIKNNAELEKQKLEVDLYTLRDRVNQLFFGILMIRDQQVQSDILRQELQTNLEKIKACLKNGVANQSDVDALSVEILNVDQRQTELKSAEASYREMLAALTGVKMDAHAALIKPLSALPNENPTIKRPELSLFDAQLQLLDNQTQLEQTAIMPKFNLFLQGGYGKPGLNMLATGFQPFYIGGIRFSWNISSFYTRKNNLDNIQTNRAMIQVAKETFLFNNNLKINQQHSEIEKMRELLRTDDDILRLRTNIKNACSAKVDHGVSTVTDLLREINAESIAKQQKSLHELQLLLQIQNLQYSTNN